MPKLACALLIMQISTNARSELAPTGKLRVGINFGNALLANKTVGGVEEGIALDLARELARRLDVPLETVGYDSAGQMADAVSAGGWDVAFLATDPDRSNEISFTPPYLEIDTTYLVPPGSVLHTLADVDRDGVRIAVSEKSAYDLFLTRSLKHATLVRVPGVNASIDLYLAQKVDALAGLRPTLVHAAAKQSGSHILEGNFTIVGQAIGIPKSRGAGAKYLREFVEDIKPSGLVAKIIDKNGIRGVAVGR